MEDFKDQKTLINKVRTILTFWFVRYRKGKRVSLKILRIMSNLWFVFFFKSCMSMTEFWV